MRLQAALKPGAYLVRRSESEPGNFVLSFVDKQLRVFNYKIASRNSQYNVSGQSKKWFGSLQNLIGYYTRYSTVKQNQHLVLPVAPPNVSSLFYSHTHISLYVYVLHLYRLYRCRLHNKESSQVRTNHWLNCPQTPKLKLSSIALCVVCVLCIQPSCQSLCPYFLYCINS